MTRGWWSRLFQSIKLSQIVLLSILHLHVPSLHKRLCHFSKVRVICFVIFQRCKLSFLVRIKSTQLSFSRLIHFFPYFSHHRLIYKQGQHIFVMSDPVIGIIVPQYMQFLLEQILLHDEDAPSTYLPLLMPWSEDLPDSCRNTIKSWTQNAEQHARRN